MDIRMLGKFSNIAQDIKFSFLVILMVASVILLHLNFRKKENILMQELKANERERAQLVTRLNNTLESIEPLKESIEPIEKSIEPLKESIEPLKTEIENLKKVFEAQKALALAQVQEPVKTNEIVWPVSAGFSSGGEGAAKPLPKVLPIASTEPSFGSEPEPAVIPVAGETEKSLSHIKDYIQTIEGENATLKKKSDDLNILFAAKEEEIAKLNRDNLALRQDMGNSLDSQKKFRDESAAQEASLKAQLSAKENETAQLMRQKTDFETRVSELTVKVDALTKANNDLQKQLSSKDRDNSSLTRELDKISQELSRQKAESEGLQNKIAQINNELTLKEKEKAALSAEIKDSGNEIVSLKKELENLFQSRKSLSSGLQDKEKIISILSDEVASVRNELRKQGTGQLKESGETDAALKQRLAEVMRELELLKLEKSSKH